MWVSACRLNFIWSTHCKIKWHTTWCWCQQEWACYLFWWVGSSFFGCFFSFTKQSFWTTTFVASPLKLQPSRSRQQLFIFVIHLSPLLKQTASSLHSSLFQFFRWLFQWKVCFFCHLWRCFSAFCIRLFISGHNSKWWHASLGEC